MTDKKWVHIIGIAGVTTGQLAVEFKRNGFLVSGSDRGVFPPISDHLTDNGVDFELGYKKEHLQLQYYKDKYGGEWNDCHREFPDFIVMQGTKGTKNEEYLFAVENNIEIKNYTDVLREFVIVPEKSIVVTGTYAKTTITSMIAWILQNAGYEVSYMFGGLNDNLGNGIRFKNDKTQFSVVEGDEYIVSSERRTSKFFEYYPKYVVLSSVRWDHTDIFRTKEDYYHNFEKLVKKIPEDGVIVYNAEDDNCRKLFQVCKGEFIPYTYLEIDNSFWKYIKELPVIGKFNQENALAASKMLLFLMLNKEDIEKGVQTFRGIKRRLEIKYQDDSFVVIDDFGASPPKAETSVKELKHHFPDYKITVVFEPNLGSRTRETLEEYWDVFIYADKVYLPRFTRVTGDYISNKDLEEFLKTKEIKALAVDSDEELVSRLVDGRSKKELVAFMGSHGFRGMIEGVIDKYKMGNIQLG